jgi:hypothetical protein
MNFLVRNSDNTKTVIGQDLITSCILLNPILVNFPIHFDY